MCIRDSTHAFNALTWFISGDLYEEDAIGETYKYKKSLLPKITPRNKNHRVLAIKNSYCFTIRGKWVDNWTEYNKDKDETTILGWGRNKVKVVKGLI